MRRLGRAPYGEDVAMTDEELTALALAAEPGAPPDPDAVPMDVYLGAVGASGPALPLWYMPPTVGRRRKRRWLLPVVIVVIGAFLLIDAFGLCNTYGILGL
jgi:hypothetical protein